MSDFKKEILDILCEVKGSGKFVSNRINQFVFPNLEIKEVGELSFPINEVQAKSLINIAQKAPFGIGKNTIIDTNIRSAWEVDANQLNFKGKQWEDFLGKAITKAKTDLGIESYNVSAFLYKMLIYETGDFFLSHRDTEKQKGMFGTMTITLPSKYTGGDLVVKFEGNEENIDFSSASADNKICFSAFYADCEHEIKPLNSGYRICLVYNLVQEQSEKIIQTPSIKTTINQLASTLNKQIKADSSKPIIVLLGHQYTPENFSLEALKLNDRYKADTLLKAATEINCYAKMCLVTSYKIGTPEYEYDNYYDYDENESGDDEAEIAEVIDESLYIEHWLENNIPSFNEICFEESDLITSFVLDEDEPLIKENSGYMGNYGPDIEHWYHYGAVMIWSHKTNAQLIANQNTRSKLEWINYLSQNLQKIDVEEILAIEEIIKVGFNQNSSDESNFDAIINWVISRKDASFFSRINNETSKYYFTKISSTQWITLLSFLSEKEANDLTEVIMQDATKQVFEQLLDLLNVVLTTKTLPQLAISQIRRIPFYFEMILKTTNENTILLNKPAVQNLFAIDYHSSQSEDWIQKIADLLVKSTNRNYLNNVLLSTLLETSSRTTLIVKTLNNCKTYYQKLANAKPSVPINWTRQMPTSTYHKREWEILKLFLESPSQEIFEYKKVQKERLEMESAIKSVTIDLKMQTIKKGSPQTLLITKTQDEYKRKLRDWEYDLNMLNKITLKLEEK